MKRWEGSGAVRAQQGSRLKSYLNLEMLFGFTVEVSYQLQFLFECLASFCGSKQEQQERKKESCWQWLNWTYRLQKFKGDGLHSAERSANDPLHFFRSTFCPFKQQFRSHSQTNCEERTDDESTFGDDLSLKIVMVVQFFGLIKKHQTKACLVFASDTFCFFSFSPDWFHQENGCKNQLDQFDQSSHLVPSPACVHVSMCVCKSVQMLLNDTLHQARR